MIYNIHAKIWENIRRPTKKDILACISCEIESEVYIALSGSLHLCITNQVKNRVVRSIVHLILRKKPWEKNLEE